jgi:hypothetical protein
VARYKLPGVFSQRVTHFRAGRSARTGFQERLAVCPQLGTCTPEPNLAAACMSCKTTRILRTAEPAPCEKQLTRNTASNNRERLANERLANERLAFGVWRLAFGVQRSTFNGRGARDVQIGRVRSFIDTLKLEKSLDTNLTTQASTPRKRQTPNAKRQTLNGER